jgi:Ran GTPase-activating protein (RanGAP) involved in mRNA processing and transport
MEGNTMRAEFTLTIEMGNDAMRTYGDIAQATRLLFSDFANRGDELLQDGSGRIYDANGNKVGTWSSDEVEPEEEEETDEDEEDEE